MSIPAPSAAPSEAPVAPVAGTPEYDAAMAAVGSSMSIQGFSADGQRVATVAAPAAPVVPPVETPTTPERPQWLPEKFQSAEDLARAYAELEAKQSGAPKTTTTAPVVEPVVDPVTPPEIAPGTDISKFSAEFAETGALSPESYEALSKAGLSREVVDGYIAGQSAMQAARTEAGYSTVGGEEQYREITGWAQANLKPAEIEAFNSQVNGSVEAAQLAIQGLQAKYQSAVGRTPQTQLRGGAAPQQQNSGFQSRAQVVEAMSDARYGNDPAFRNAVIQRLAMTADAVI